MEDTIWRTVGGGYHMEDTVWRTLCGGQRVEAARAPPGSGQLVAAGAARDVGTSPPSALQAPGTAVSR